MADNGDLMFLNVHCASVLHSFQNVYKCVRLDIWASQDIHVSAELVGTRNLGNPSTIVSKSYRWNFLFYLQRLLLTIALAEQGPMDVINFGIHVAEHTAPIFDHMHL